MALSGHAGRRHPRQLSGTKRTPQISAAAVANRVYFDIARCPLWVVKLEIFSTRRLNRAKALSSFRLVEVALALVWPSALIAV
jgi:hypothetical protein